ncbi:MAG: T9SS type A sorting domain-containing protein [Salinibacter sp.]
MATTGSFSEFVMASNSEGLPVELAGLNAQPDEQAVELTWQTLSEQNNAGFEVQRKVLSARSEGSSWSSLGFVESKASGGTTPETIRYQFRDPALPFEARRVAYRLRQVDTDGTAHLSEKTSVQLGAPDRLALHGSFPNPVRGQTTVRYELPETAEVRLLLYNVLGQRVATLVDEQQPAGRKQIQFEAPELASGTYLLRLTAGGQTRSRKLTILR